MIAKTLRTFFGNLIYILIPLGSLFLAAMIGAGVLLRGIQGQCAALVNNINTILKDSQIRMDELLYGIIRSAAALSWEHPLRALAQIFTTNWLAERIAEIANVTTETVEGITTGIASAAKSALSGTVPYLVFFAIVLAVGMFAGFFVTKYIVRKNSVASRGYILWSLLEAALFLGVFLLSLWLISLWKYSFYILIVLIIPLFWLITLAEAYFTQPQKLHTFKEIIDIRNSYTLILSSAILLLVSGGLLRAVYAIGDFFITFALAYPLITIVLVVMSLSGRLYADHLTERRLFSARFTPAQPAAPPAREETEEPAEEEKTE